MRANTSVMNCNGYILSVSITMKKIHLSTTIFNEFTSTHYDNKNNDSGLFLRRYTENSVNNIPPRLSSTMKSKHGQGSL